MTLINVYLLTCYIASNFTGMCSVQTGNALRTDTTSEKRSVKRAAESMAPQHFRKMCLLPMDSRGASNAPSQAQGNYAETVARRKKIIMFTLQTADSTFYMCSERPKLLHEAVHFREQKQELHLE